ncbi:uncharacterized protein LOC128882029 isoform X2 [Hylaeus volcanicus]|uniref:uncharacterized protein LOC128882029 isoform X2 n=2 Tax=Hylaeus volcanicus TaxID=313075 RepID=UPI0023B7BF8C|nr:uncharacterized protein LOC128882029 isoform X2 [Hylaeus volcanicus]
MCRAGENLAGSYESTAVSNIDTTWDEPGHRLPTFETVKYNLTLVLEVVKTFGTLWNITAKTECFSSFLRVFNCVFQLLPTARFAPKMIGRTSLVEQKRIQWAREREEMARFGGNWGLLKNNANIRTSIRYPSDARMSLAETKDKHTPSKPFRAAGHYGSTVSLKSLASETSANGTTSLKCLDYNGGSLINLHEQPEVAQIRHRSPSLPPIYCKEQQYQSQGQQRDFVVAGLRHQPEKPQRHDRRSSDHYANLENNNYGSQGEEREGETSGYASDSVDAPVTASGTFLPGCKPPAGYMMDKTWQNPYYNTPESSLPSSRRLSDSRMGELNRPRWGSVWGQETARGDPPAPSWLARLGHSSQVLVINHESASSSDSSTIGSTGSDNKTYLRGQNIPVDANVLQEREARRQKALELQNAIKKQLEEKDRRRKEEKERRLREERLEEERIKREREKEKERFEEEQKRIREREAAKLRQAEAMREVLEAAERLAKEQKKTRHKREEIDEETTSTSSRNCESSSSQFDKSYPSVRADQSANFNNELDTNTEIKDPVSEKEDNQKETYVPEKPEDPNNVKPVQVPISKDVAIVLSGRLEDSELLNKANLQLVNLVLTPSPTNFQSNTTNVSVGLNSFVHNLGNLNFTSINEKRLLTPSKHRTMNGRDFGTQTDIENDLGDFQEEMQIKDVSIKDHKDATNASKRDIEKSTGEINVRTFPRSKSQPRTSIESRPQWNANRPGTRYRTQSEKDPHYQRRMRMRRRQVESSDERSRSPSPDRRKLVNMKTKIRTNRRKVKGDSYDADLSMDSLNSIVPLRTDKNGRIHVQDNKCERNDKENENSNVWCGQEILSKLSSLKNGLLMKQIEWDSERCLVSPAASGIF